MRNSGPRRTLQWKYAYGPMVVLGGRVVSDERGTPVEPSIIRASTALEVHSMPGQFFGFQNATFRFAV